MPPCPEELLFDSITARCIDENIAVCDVTEPETTTEDPTDPTVPTAPTKPLDPSPTTEEIASEPTTEITTESTYETTTAIADDVPTAPTVSIG